MAARFALLLVLSAAPAASARVALEPPIARITPAPLLPPGIAWQTSRPVGLFAGRLRAQGVQLPPEGLEWFTWARHRLSPNRDSRLWGTDRLVRTLLPVISG